MYWISLKKKSKMNCLVNSGSDVFPMVSVRPISLRTRRGRLLTVTTGSALLLDAVVSSAVRC